MNREELIQVLQVVLLYLEGIEEQKLIDYGFNPSLIDTGIRLSNFLKSKSTKFNREAQQ